MNKLNIFIISDIKRNRYYVIRNNTNGILSVGDVKIEGSLVSICDTYKDAEIITKNLTY